MSTYQLKYQSTWFHFYILVKIYQNMHSSRPNKNSPIKIIPDFLEKLTKTRKTIAELTIPSSLTTQNSPLKSSSSLILIKKQENRLPSISIHRNPLSLFTEREIRNDIRRLPKKITPQKSTEWAVRRNIVYGITN